MIRIKELVKNYSDSSQIGPINLDIPSYGITSIIGPNGAGKSSLLMMMGRLLDKDRGTVLYGDQNKKANSQELAKQVAILRQDNHFVSRLTVKQLVSFGRFPYSKGRINCVDEKIILKYLDFLGLQSLADRYLDELSGGQRQRAYVAMVLAQETPYVLLDEPLNNLDITHSVQMMNHLRQACDEMERTIVLVLHDINYAAKYSDYICAMKEGQVYAFASVEEMMDEKILSEIFSIDISVIEGPHGPLAIS